MKYLFFAGFCFVMFIACNNNSKVDTSKNDSALKTISPLLDIMQKQLKQFPDSAALRLQYAFLLDSFNLPHQALAELNTLIKKDSLNYGLLYARGQIAEDAKDTTLALKSYAKAAGVYESPDVLLALANLYAEMKNERAVVLCSRIKALSSGRQTDANCAFIMGIYYARSGKTNEALKYFDECIANNYTYMEAYIEKGLIYFDAAQYYKALKVFQLAATVNNLYADAYYYQARCYEMLNKKDSAVLRFKQSLQLDPALDEAGEHLKNLER